MKEVLFIFYQTPNQANGGVNSLVEIILNLRLVRPVVLTQRETTVNEKLRKAGVEIVVANKVGMNVSIKALPAFVRYQAMLTKLLKNRSFAAVHINDIQSLIYSIGVLKLHRQTVIFNLRGVIQKNRTYNQKWNLVNLCRHVVVLSQEMKSELERRLPIKGANRKDSFIRHIYSIVDFDRFRPGGERPTDGGVIKILYAAAFNDLKNQLELLANWKDFLKNNKVELHLVGDVDNAYGQKCLAFVAQKGLEAKVIFHGYQAEIEKFYRQATITLVASRREGLARCMIESLACGTPVVSFDVCSAREILETDHPSGAVVMQGYYGKLGDETLRLGSDLQLREKWSANGVAISRALFDRELAIEAYEDIYLKG